MSGQKLYVVDIESLFIIFDIVMRILITGGAGYIGSHCVALSLERGHDVMVFDNLSTGHREMVDGRAKFFPGDITKPIEIREAISDYRPDIVMHFAAKCVIPDSMARPAYYWEQNVGGTINILRAMVDSGVDKMVFSSSVAVYGDPLEIPIQETTGLCPISPYGTTKIACERAIADVGGSGAIRYVNLRYFNVAGAGMGLGCMTDNETRLIPLTVKAALGKVDSIVVFGDDYSTRDGSCIRDFIHVMDIAEGHHAAMEYLENGGESETINLGTGEGYSVFEIIEKVREILQKPFKVDISARRDGDTPVVVASKGKAWSLLRWKPERDLEKILRSTIEWEKRNIV